MDWEMEKTFIMEIPSLGEMFAGILEWPQIWPHAWWGMSSKVNIYYFKIDGVTVGVHAGGKKIYLQRREDLVCAVAQPLPRVGVGGYRVGLCQREQGTDPPGRQLQCTQVLFWAVLASCQML